MIRGFLFTGGKIQYDYYIKSNNLNPAEFPMLKSMEQLQGYTSMVIVKVGTYYMNPLHEKVYEWEKLNNV